MQQALEVKGSEPLHFDLFARLRALLAFDLKLGALIAGMSATGNALLCTLVRVAPRAQLGFRGR